ncbi:unnamed protein product, partial [Prorocentrum cordatum]
WGSRDRWHEQHTHLPYFTVSGSKITALQQCQEAEEGDEASRRVTVDLPARCSNLPGWSRGNAAASAKPLFNLHLIVRSAPTWRLLLKSGGGFL